MGRRRPSGVLASPMSTRVKDLPLVLARDYEGGNAAALQRRVGEGQPWLQLRIDRCDPAVPLVEHRVVDEQRCGVTVVADAEQREIEQRAVHAQGFGAIELLQAVSYCAAASSRSMPSVGIACTFSCGAGARDRKVLCTMVQSCLQDARVSRSAHPR